MGAHWTRSDETAPLRPFRDRLASLGFEGEFASKTAARLVAATDDSIYQVVPAAVVYRRTSDDLNRIVLAARAAGISVSPRGGGTGTNGQSLTNGVMVDLSRHLDRIGLLDVEAGIVTVEPGVVLDQLNAFLARHGLFFAPMVSTASRATIGGMVATDVSGKGSRVYGETSAHVASLDVVLSDGSDGAVRPLDRAGFGVTARRAQAERLRLGASGLPVVSLDAATGLLFDHDDQEFAHSGGVSPVLSIEGFLAAEIHAGRLPGMDRTDAGRFTVLLHCTECAARPETAERWRRVFGHFGLETDLSSAGCCGMAGLFGHEAEHAELSRRIFGLGWRPRVDAAPAAGRVLATGFSCRRQTKPLAGLRPPHPVEAILAHLERTRA